MATLTKFHRTNEGKLAPCNATKRACKYGANEHTFLSAEQQLFMRDVLGVIDKDVELNLEAETLRADLERDVMSLDKMRPAQNAISKADVAEIVQQALADHAFTSEYRVTCEEWRELTSAPFDVNYGDAGFNRWGSSIDYEYDSYGNPPGYDMENDDGYGRGSVYTGLRVNPHISSEKVAKDLFEPKNPLALRAAIGYVESNRLDQAEAYRAVAHGGYYGQEAEIEITSWAERKIAEFKDLFPAQAAPARRRGPRRGSGAKE